MLSASEIRPEVGSKKAERQQSFALQGPTRAAPLAENAGVGGARRLRVSKMSGVEGDNELRVSNMSGVEGDNGLRVRSRHGGGGLRIKSWIMSITKDERK